MASYGYQYGTSPRKLEPDVRSPKKSTKKVTSNNKKTNKSSKASNTKKTKPVKKTKKQQDKIKAKELKLAKTNFAILMLVALGSILLLMYRNVKIRESYAGVQELSKSVSAIEKENSQISIQLQNNLNLNNIEEIAASTLGMQKLSSKQIIYVNLDTKDYTEITQKSIVKEEKVGFFERIINKIVDFF